MSTPFISLLEKQALEYRQAAMDCDSAMIQARLLRMALVTEAALYEAQRAHGAETASQVCTLGGGYR